MSVRRATLETVRRAVARLQIDGDQPSANNVIAITGGNKNAVLALIRIVMAEQAAGLAQMDEGQAFAKEVAEPLIARLWSEAMHRATLMLQEKIDRVGDLQEGFMDELAAALDKAEAMSERAAAAEKQLQVLEKELRAQRELQGTVSELRALVSVLRPKPTISAPEQCLLLLAEARNGLSRNELRSMLVDKGYSRGEANTGRYRIVKEWGDAFEVNEGNDPIVKLTESGRTKVAALKGKPGLPD